MWPQVCELGSMLKAWEAMRLSKDAQIAALMERCKRYDEDLHEKSRSNEALRRKLSHPHAPAAPSSSSQGHTAAPRGGGGDAQPHRYQQSVAGDAQPHRYQQSGYGGLSASAGAAHGGAMQQAARLSALSTPTASIAGSVAGSEAQYTARSGATSAATARAQMAALSVGALAEQGGSQPAGRHIHLHMHGSNGSAPAQQRPR